MTFPRKAVASAFVLAALLAPGRAGAGTNMHLIGTTPVKDAVVRSATVPQVVFIYDVDLDAPPLSTIGLTDGAGSPVSGTNALCGATSSTGGKRSLCFTPAAPLHDSGAGHYTARATVRSGPNADSIDSASFTIDDIAPGAPVVTSPADGGFTYRYTTFRGSAERGALVTLSGWTPGAAVYASTTDGAWATTVPIADGTYSVSATATDAAGNVSVPSSPLTFTADSVPPDAPVIASPEPGAVIVATSITVSGTAEPYSKLSVLDGGVPKVLVTLGATPSWSATFPATDGAHTITSWTADRTFNRSETTAPVPVWVDSRNGVPRVDSPVEQQSVATGVVTVSGFGRPGWTVKIREGTTLMASPPVAANGLWSASATFGEGLNSITVTGVDPSSHESAAETRTFRVDTHAPAPPVVSAPVSGSTARASIGASFSGTAEPNASVAIATQLGFLTRIPVGANGSWSTTVFLSDGDYAVALYAIDAAGNSSLPTRLSLTVDGIRPLVGFSTASGAVLALDAMHVDGTASDERAVDKVLVRCINALSQQMCFKYAAITTDPSGTSATWSIPVTGLTPGKYQIRAQAFDVAGNPSLEKTLDVVIAM